MRYLGGHIGSAVSALVDGQLDQATSERAWTHVLSCGTCQAQVEHEGWVKTRLASISGGEPPPQLLGSLYSLEPASDVAADAWAAVAQLEREGRGRRRAGLALAGAGSVSAAVLGFVSLTGATLGVGGAATPAATVDRPSTPHSTVRVSTTAAPGPTLPPGAVVPPRTAGFAPAFAFRERRTPAG